MDQNISILYWMKIQNYSQIHRLESANQLCPRPITELELPKFELNKLEPHLNELTELARYESEPLRIRTSVIFSVLKILIWL